MADKKEIKVKMKAKYERDSKNYHVYKIEGSDEIVGSLYIGKTADPFPKQVLIELYSK